MGVFHIKPKSKNLKLQFEQDKYAFFGELKSDAYRNKHHKPS